jgi:hypothetical protein
MVQIIPISGNVDNIPFYKDNLSEDTFEKLMAFHEYQEGNRVSLIRRRYAARLSI